MSSTFNTSNYYTRAQANALFPKAPVAPGISVADTGITYIDLSIEDPTVPEWAQDAPAYIVGYRVQVIVGSVVTIVFLSKAGDRRISNLIAGSTFNIRVAATDYLGQTGAYCAPLAVSTLPNTVPPAVPGLGVVPLAVGALITVAPYNTEPDFIQYDVYRDTSASLHSNGSLLPAASFKGESFTDLAYSASGNYYYYLRARNSSGLYSDSVILGPIAIVGQPLHTPAPISMAGVTATSHTDGSISFPFPVSSDAYLTGYNIWRQWTEGMTGWVLISTVPAGTNTFTDTTGTSGMTYQYSVSVVNTYGESAFDTTHVVQATSIDTTAPTAPLGNLQYSGVTGGISVTWDTSPDPATTSYLIRWRYAQAGPYSSFSDSEKVVGTSFLIQGLEDPLTGLPPTRDALANLFEVEVASIDSSNNASGYVARRDTTGVRIPIEYPELTGYRPANSAQPQPPVLSSPTFNPDSSITLNWQAPASSTQAGFLIEKLLTGSPAWESLQQVLDSNNGTKRFTATGLEPFKFRGTQYRFRVRTLDNTGNLSAANLVENSEFTSGLTGWSYTVPPALVAPGYNGTGQAVKVSNTIVLKQTLAVTGGLSYTLSGYYAKDTDASVRAVLSLMWINGAQTLNVQAPAKLVDTAYQRVSVSSIAPTWATSVMITLSGDAVSGHTALWTAIQLEQSSLVSPYGDSKTAWLNAIDTVGPTLYNPALTVKPDLGSFHISWMNGTTSDYINSTYEIWRQRTASTASGFIADPALVKIVEVPGHDSGSASTWTDSSPDVNEKLQAIYAIRARDRFGNANVDSSGSPIFLATSLSQTSFDVDDKAIATAGEVATLTVAAAAAAATANSASAAASAAQADATTALGSLSAISSDNLLSMGEKSSVILDKTNLLAEQAGIDAQATSYSITTQKTAYDNAVTALTTYLATLTSPTLWSDVTGNTTIVGTTFRSTFALVYSTRQTLLNAIYAAAQTLANAAQTQANLGVTNAATALSAATSAQTAANLANSQLANIASDNVLSAGEKSTVILDYNQIINEQAGLDAQANLYNLTTLKTAYDASVTSLTTYLATLTTPVLWSSTTGDTTIVGTTFRNTFAAVYTARQNLLNGITAAVNPIINLMPAQAGADVTSLQPIAYSGVSESIVPNGNFLLGNTQGWTLTGTGVALGTFGGASVAPGTLYLPGSAPGSNSACTPSFQVVPGKTYRIIVVASGWNNSGGGQLLRILYSPSFPVSPTSFACPTYSNVAMVIATSTTSWSTFTYDWTCPAGQNAAALILFPTSTTGDIMIQSVSCVPYGSAAQWGADQTALQPIAYTGASESIVPNGNFLLGNSLGWSAVGYTYGTDSFGVRVYSTANNTTGYLFSPSFAVVPGKKYRITFNVYNGSGSGGVFLRINYQSAFAANVSAATFNDFMANGSITTSPVDYIYDWTCPAGMYWASLGMYNIGGSDLAIKRVSCIPYGSAAQWGADKSIGNTSTIFVRTQSLTPNNYMFSLGSEVSDSSASMGKAFQFTAGWAVANRVNGTNGFVAGDYDIYVRVCSNGAGNSSTNLSGGLYNNTTAGGVASFSLPVTTSYTEVYAGRVTLTQAMLGQDVYMYFSSAGITTVFNIDYIKFVPCLAIFGSVPVTKIGYAVDPNGNLLFKNIKQVAGVTAGQSVVAGPSFGALADLNAGNSAMTITTKGNPCLVSISLSFSSLNSGGTIASANVVQAGYYTTPGNLVFSGDGVGGYVSATWTYHAGTPPWFTLTINGVNPGSGYTWASLVVSGGIYSQQAVAGVTISTPSVNAAVPVTVQVLMDGSPVIYPLTVNTNASGQASFTESALLFPLSAGNHTFEVQAYKTTAPSVSQGSRAFNLVELG